MESLFQGTQRGKIITSHEVKDRVITSPFDIISEDSLLDFDNFLFLNVDLTNVTSWSAFPLEKTSFWGCTFTLDNKPHEAHEILEERNTPFKQFCGSMYSQDQLLAIDLSISQFANRHRGNLTSEKQMLFHDITLRFCLEKYLQEQKKPTIVFFGGHSMKRTSIQYRQTTLLAKHLAEKGFIILNGGGPGSMEASSLGAYLGGRSNEEVEEALALLSEGNEAFDVEYKNRAAPENVIKRFGNPSDSKYVSIGIPTFLYTDEPSNRFSTFICKIFSKPIRQSTLIDLGQSYIICQGSVGTREELFSAICKNSDLADLSFECRPIIFFHQTFWKNNGIAKIAVEMSLNSAYENLFLLSDNCVEIESFIQARKK